MTFGQHSPRSTQKQAASVPSVHTTIYGSSPFQDQSRVDNQTFTKFFLAPRTSSSSIVHQLFELGWQKPACLLVKCSPARTQPIPYKGPLENRKRMLTGSVPVGGSVLTTDHDPAPPKKIPGILSNTLHGCVHGLWSATLGAEIGQASFTHASACHVQTSGPSLFA